MSPAGPSSPFHEITIVAHRGLHTEHPENSQPAFDAARNAGIAWIEFDVWASSDGHPVVIHDETLDRTTEGTGPVGEKTAGELKKVRLRNARGELTGSHLLTELPGGSGGLLVEIKPANAPELVRRVLQDLKQRGGVWQIQSFDSLNLNHLFAIDPNAPGALLIEEAAVLDRAMGERWRMICARHDLLNGESIAELHRLGTSVGVWTVNGPDDIRRAVLMKPDIIISDDPLAVRGVIGEFRDEGICEAPSGEKNPHPNHLPGYRARGSEDKSDR